MKAIETLSPDQIKDAEKMCQTLAVIPVHKRKIVATAVVAYINGIETGMAMERSKREKMEK